MKSILIPFAISALLLVTSCDWREFDDLSDQATVKVLDAPSGFSSANFGQISSVILDENGKIVPSSYLVAGSGLSPVALVSFANRDVVPLIYSYTEELTINKIESLGISQNQKIRFLAAENKYGRVHIFNLDPQSEDYMLTEETVLTGGTGFGNDIYAAQYNGTPFYLIAANDTVFYYENFNAAEGKLVPLPQGFQLPQISDTSGFKPYNILSSIQSAYSNNFVIGGSITDENSNQYWAVAIVSDSDIIDATSINYTMLTGSEAYPGEEVSSIKIADVNGDGTKDLLIGTEDSIYVFYRTDSNLVPEYSQTPDVVLYYAGAGLGYSVETVDLNADGIPEVVASNPYYQVDSGKLGMVAIYVTPFSKSKLSPAVLIEAPESEKMFGSSIIGVPTNIWNNRDELIVGGLNASYLMFLTGLDGDNNPDLNDPRLQ